LPDFSESKPRRILLVDDEPSLLTVMEQYLRRLGYEVVACRSGQQAWQLFEPEPSSYALVLADATLPDLSGAELLLRMLDRNPAICPLISSGYPFDRSSLPAQVRDRVDFLQKPFTPKMLEDAVIRLIGKPPAGPSAGRTKP
jgi:two-component system response regulator HydG